MAERRRGARIRQGDGPLPAQGLGHFAPALLGHADSYYLLRAVRDRSGAGKRLPVVLPRNVKLTVAGGSPLGVPGILSRRAAPSAAAARRETDTMDTFVDSSWYFYRYTSPDRDRALRFGVVAKYWFAIDQYIGGIEHAILHLIYTRFWTKVMRDIGLMGNDEPATRLFTQGMVIKDGAKMSKSLGNVVSPDDMVARYSADTTRLYTLFAAPPDRDLDWQDQGVEGVSRFLNKAHRFLSEAPVKSARRRAARLLRRRVHSAGSRAVVRKMHQTIKRITEELNGRWHFNTCVAGLHGISRHLHRTARNHSARVRFG